MVNELITVWGWTGSIALPVRKSLECFMPQGRSLAMEKVIWRFPDLWDENSYAAFG